MFESVPSLSNEISFAEVIERLIVSGRVEGIALFGSAQTTLPHASSDYDLLILTRKPDVHIFQMHTWIDGISADVVFVESELAEHVLTITTPVSATSLKGLSLAGCKRQTSSMRMTRLTESSHDFKTKSVNGNGEHSK